MSLLPLPPQPLEQKGRREIGCPFYDHCLSYAVRRRWDFWSCEQCPNQGLEAISQKIQFIEQYYDMLAEIYPEFRAKYEPFMNFADQTAAGTHGSQNR